MHFIEKSSVVTGDLKLRIQSFLSGRTKKVVVELKEHGQKS